MPATDAVTMTRDGSSCVAFFWSRGANLTLVSICWVARNKRRACQKMKMKHPSFKINMNLQSNRPKHTLDIQIHHLRKRTIWMCIELLAPRRSCICKQDIHTIRGFLHLGHQLFDPFDLAAICGYRNRLRAWRFIGKRIESGTGGFACGRFAGGDVDFGTAGLEEAVDGMKGSAEE